MLKSLKIFREEHHAWILYLRQLDYIVQSDAFEMAFSWATLDEQEAVYSNIQTNNKPAVEKFIKSQFDKFTTFERMSIRKLRVIGQHLRIEDYQYLNKLTLVEEIEHAVQRNKENAKRVPCEPEIKGIGVN